MDTLSTLDIFAVGVIESLLFYVFGYWVCTGKLKPRKYGVIKYILAIILQLLVILYSRSHFQNMNIMSLITFITSTIIIWTLFKQNFRKAVTAALFIALLSMAFESVLYPLYGEILSYYNIEEFFKYRTLMYIPVRILQLWTFYLLFKRKAHLNRHVLYMMDYTDLDTIERRAVIRIILSLFSSCVILINFIQIVVKLKNSEIVFESFTISLALILGAVVVHIIITIMQIVKTIDYDTKTHALNQYKRMLEFKRKEVGSKCKGVRTL